MTIRYIEINNPKLLALVEKKGEIVGRGREHYKKMEKLNEEGNAIGEERNAIVKEIIELTGELLQKEDIGEFELATTTDIHNGVVRVQIIDQLAQFKDNVRKQKDKAVRAEKGELTEQEKIEINKKKLNAKIQLLEEDQVVEALEKLLATFE